MIRLLADVIFKIKKIVFNYITANDNSANSNNLY